MSSSTVRYHPNDVSLFLSSFLPTCTFFLILAIYTFVTLYLPSFWDGFPNFHPRIPNFNFCHPQIWRYGLWFCSGCYDNMGLWSGPGPDQLHFCQLYGCLQLHQEPKVLRTGLLLVPAWPGEAGGEQQSALSPMPQALAGHLYALWPDASNISTSKASFWMCKVILNKLR